jgi:hypothetical protein
MVNENVKNALKTMWTDSCNVIEFQEVLNSNHTTTHQEVTTLENVPCKLSFETLQETNQTDTGAKIVQKTKIILDNEVEIKPGSKIIITRGNDTFQYQHSGEVGEFHNHQEIELVPFKEWA